MRFDWPVALAALAVIPLALAGEDVIGCAAGKIGCLPAIQINRQIARPLQR